MNNGTQLTDIDDRMEKRTHASVRTCVGCGEEGTADAFLRFVCGPVLPEGFAEVAVDASSGPHPGGRKGAGSGGAGGRGAHVHPDRACLDKAAKSGLARSFRCKVKVSGDELAKQVVEALDRRTTGLLMAAARTRGLTLGADSTIEAIGRSAKDDLLVLVATDAGSIAQDSAIRHAADAGNVVVWSTKAALGALAGRGELAVMAVTNASISHEIRLVRSRSEACSRPEVR
jgi:predicted RNA-binding protein YlxR (DUF448 family)